MLKVVNNTVQSLVFMIVYIVILLLLLFLLLYVFSITESFNDTIVPYNSLNVRNTQEASPYQRDFEAIRQIFPITYNEDKFNIFTDQSLFNYPSYEIFLANDIIAEYVKEILQIHLHKSLKGSKSIVEPIRKLYNVRWQDDDKGNRHFVSNMDVRINPEVVILKLSVYVVIQGYKDGSSISTGQINLIRLSILNDSIDDKTLDVKALPSPDTLPHALRTMNTLYLLRPYVTNN